MNLPLVTVLIDTYNYGHFIEEAIESVLSQDFPAEQMEILVVDDGSTDDTAERVKKYVARIRYFLKPNGGQASAFNFGLRRSRGDIKQWDLAQEGDAFAVAPPGRIQFSRHLVQYARNYGPRMTWRHHAVTYLCRRVAGGGR